MISDRFLQQIPKTDLHLHLDGSLRLPTLIELARRQRIKLPSHSPAGLRRLVFKDRYADLPEYLRGFAFTCAVMRDAESLERIAFELAEDNLAEGVRYIEVRFAPPTPRPREAHARRSRPRGQSRAGARAAGA